MKTINLLTATVTTICMVLTPVASSIAGPDYTLHEWGTFTTVIGSDGTHLSGVHLEDAPLPEFVYELDDNAPSVLVRTRFTKGLTFSAGRSFVGVNVRLETPVLYFYTDEKFDAQVDVGFKGGTIGQWFPQRSAGEKPAPAGRLDFRQPREGSIRWNVRVEPPGEDRAARIFRPGELPNWIYPRYPDSALVTNAEGETESYLFYRGLGRMELPVKFTASNSELKLHVPGENAIGGYLVFDHNPKGGGVRYWKPDPISAGGTATVNLTNQQYRSDWRKRLYADGVAMLKDAGLNRDEADAMMQTWWESYFEAPGLRVFWIVPRATVDEVLPLTVKPAPKHVERVIVGRSEILLPSFESQLVADFAKAENPWKEDRFFPAYASRVRMLKPAPVAAAAAPSPARLASRPLRTNWNEQISSAKLGANVRVVAYEKANFEGTKMVLNGSAIADGTSGNYGLFLNIDQGLRRPANWNDRITSLKVMDGRAGDRTEAPGDSLRVTLFQDSHFGGKSMTLEVGDEIADLTKRNLTPKPAAGL